MQNMNQWMMAAILTLCSAMTFISCKKENKGATAAAGNASQETALADSTTAENDTTQLPMFLMGGDKHYMHMLYWTEIDEPQRTDDDAEWFDDVHQSWAMQDMFRRNIAQYTNLLKTDGTAKVKFVDEVLKDPDGNTPSFGEIHGRPEIPALCARFDYENPKDAEGSLGIIVTDSYLKSRQRLDIDDVSDWNDPKPLPEAVAKQLEKKYGMKIERTLLLSTIGKDYAWGLLQFQGAYKDAPKDKYDPDRQSALALDVLMKGDEVWVNEELGYYDERYGASWNADDDGNYVGCDIMAAFEGPNGLELCYNRRAPESTAVGLFFQREERLVRCNYETYHNMIDEEIPVWKKDIAEMQKLFVADDPHEHKDIKFTKWCHCYIDLDNEWIWLRDKEEQNGAFFIRKDGKFRLVAVETPKLKPSYMHKDGVNYLMISGSAGGPATYSQIHAFKDGKQIETFSALCVYGEIDECSLNGKNMDKEKGQAYLDRLPEAQEVFGYFKDIDENQ